MSWTHEQLLALVSLLAKHFNSQEFNDLAFNYGIDLDNLGVSGPKNWAREIALYAQRHIEQDKLLSAIHQVKPQLDLRPFGGPAPQIVPKAELTPNPVDPPKPTAVRQYINFDIEIGEKRSDGRYPINARSEQGYGEIEKPIFMALPDDDDFNDALTYLRQRVAQPADAEILGRKLRNFLFPRDVSDLYNLSSAKIKAEGKTGLRIRLRISRDAPELSQLPWEYCFGDKNFLALDTDTPFVRYIQTMEIPTPIATPEKVRILVVIASPNDQPELKGEEEEAWIQTALKKYQDAGRVEVRVLQHATKRDLRLQFRRFDPHILHFIGHGEFKNDVGTLVLENDEGKSSRVSAKDLQVLMQSNGVKLVILNACKTAAHGTSDAIMGIAPRLVWASVPAVVAMQLKIPDKTAIGFSRDLYQFLADGEPLDSAVTEARIGAYFDNEDKVFWAIPVLFMRAPNGIIWQ